jgi:hypothetical protein
MFDKHMNLHHAAIHTLRSFNAAILRVKQDFWQASCNVVAFQDVCFACQLACRSDLVYKISEAWQCFQQSFAGHIHGVYKEFWEIKIKMQTGVYFENARRDPCNFILVQVSCQRRKRVGCYFNHIVLIRPAWMLTEKNSSWYNQDQLGKWLNQPDGWNAVVLTVWSTS